MRLSTEGGLKVEHVIKCSPNTHTSINLGNGCMVLVPTEQLIVSIYNNTPFMKNFEEKTILIEGVWDNGDGVEVQIRRVPKRGV